MNSGTLRNHYSTTYGIVRDSVLNQSNFFHVTNGLVPDIMHDVLEGCAQYEAKELIKYLIAQKIISLDYLNEQIEFFPYAPPDATSKPTMIPTSTLKSPDHSLKQKGVCNCLCCTLLMYM